MSLRLCGPPPLTDAHPRCALAHTGLQFQKMADRMYALLAICTILLPQKLEDNVEATLKEKHGDAMDKFVRTYVHEGREREKERKK
jgi:hypothetical protein